MRVQYVVHHLNFPSYNPRPGVDGLNNVLGQFDNDGIEVNAFVDIHLGCPVIEYG